MATGFRMIAYVPDRHRPHLNPDLVDHFARCGVEMRRLAVAGTMWARPYPQNSLPVTLKRHGLGYVLAPEAMNLSTQARIETGHEAPVLMHYHRFRYLADWPRHQAMAFAQTRTLAGEALYARLVQAYGPMWHGHAAGTATGAEARVSPAAT